VTLFDFTIALLLHFVVDAAISKGDVKLTESTRVLLVLALSWHFVAAAAALCGAVMLCGSTVVLLVLAIGLHPIVDADT